MTEEQAHVRSWFLADDVAGYVADHTSPPDEVRAALRTTTAERFPQAARMQVGDDQAVLLEILCRSMGARRAIEVGTFTGASALAIATGMGPEGRLLCCDASDEWTAVAREHWERAGVADRIELRLGPALDTLRSLPADEAVDLAFLDADKDAYPAYYAELVPRLRPGGLLLVDNSLMGGRVLADDGADDANPGVAGVRRLNELVMADPGVRSVLLAVGDGINVVQKVP